KLPPLLVGDAVALLDDQEVDEARERIGQERQVFFPVAWRMGEGPHLVERQGQRRPVAALGGELEITAQPRLADSRRTRAGHQQLTAPRRRAASPRSPRARGS